jgi:hypothetical protein
MAITIRSSFVVDAKPEDAWRSLTDIEQAAPCFPGAELQERQPDGSYKGAFTVKLGPLTFKFNGKFKIAQQDDAARHLVVAASGTDTKGRGGADANINVQLSDEAGKSKVDVVSEVNLSGTVAQYGRGVGMIEALSQQLLNQFSKNLAAQILSQGAQQAPAATPEPAPAPAPAQAQDAAAAASAAPAAPAPAVAPQPQAPAPRPAPVAAAPLDAGKLMRQAMWQSVRSFFARLFGGGKEN